MDANTAIVASAALVTAIGGALKQIKDNKELKQWLCTRNPCKDRTKGEPPPETV
jgi:hypothetical protein